MQKLRHLFTCEFTPHTLRHRAAKFLEPSGVFLGCASGSIQSDQKSMAMESTTLPPTTTGMDKSAPIESVLVKLSPSVPLISRGYGLFQDQITFCLGGIFQRGKLKAEQANKDSSFRLFLLVHSGKAQKGGGATFLKRRDLSCCIFFGHNCIFFRFSAEFLKIKMTRSHSDHKIIGASNSLVYNVLLRI